MAKILGGILVELCSEAIYLKPQLEEEAAHKWTLLMGDGLAATTPSIILHILCPMLMRLHFWPSLPPYLPQFVPLTLIVLAPIPSFSTL